MLILSSICFCFFFFLFFQQVSLLPPLGWPYKGKNVNDYEEMHVFLKKEYDVSSDILICCPSNLYLLPY
jgi:hypothetical protein